MAPTNAKSNQVATRYIPVASFKDFHPWPTPQGLRNRIAAAKKLLQRAEQGDQIVQDEIDRARNFLQCIKWVGGRVLVDEQAFFDWREQQAITERERMGWLAGW